MGCLHSNCIFIFPNKNYYNIANDYVKMIECHKCFNIKIINYNYQLFSFLIENKHKSRSNINNIIYISKINYCNNINKYCDIKKNDYFP